MLRRPLRCGCDLYLLVNDVVVGWYLVAFAVGVGRNQRVLLLALELRRLLSKPRSVSWGASICASTHS